MTQSVAISDTRVPDPHQDTFSKTIFGFWVYLMTDSILFGSLFVTYGTLHHRTFGGPSSHDIFTLPLVIAETAVLLLSSVTCGLGLLAAVRKKKKALLGWFAIAFLMGLSFVGMELFEFSHLVREGHTWQKSAFLTSFFSLVGTHGTHVSVGLIWLLVLMGQVLRKGVTVTTFRRLVCFNMFWHFLDLVWIFIFTFVYLMGVL
ncbi:MAG: cytochrome o ubiquinol oxidase subunit III [Rhabdochlamydiaceae bacterium]|jgi:cytochrome o ubiquinol oxidase subunit 3